MTISSSLQFSNLTDIFSVTPDLIDIYYEEFNIDNGNSTSLNEINLASIFNKNTLGLQVYRGNVNDLTDWTRIREKNNGDIQQNNCNKSNNTRCAF